MKHQYRMSALLLSSVLLSPLAAQADQMTELLGQPPGVPLHAPDGSVNSQYYLPSPPDKGSADYKEDEAAYLKGYAMKGSPRWQQATTDADLHIANVAQIFSQVLGTPIDQKKTPATWTLLGDLLVAGAVDAPAAAKEHYMRVRPFVVFGHHTCQSVSDEEELRKNGSYPSGHTTFGTLTALVLAQVRPDRAQELAKRAWDYGQSRVICGAHWQSDVNAGRYVGAVEFARLQTLPAFQQALKQASAELKPTATQ